jgi:DNA-binding transcriptional MerR regulator
MATTQEQLTIDELARKTGMTVRNIRAHQSRGLLAPPEVRGRTGFYGPDHVARVEAIRQMQADGFSLDLIRRMLENSNGRSSDALRFTRALREPFADEEPVVLTIEELADRFGGGGDPKVLARAEALGMLRLLPDGNVELLSPRLGDAGEELANLGIPIEKALDVVARIRKNADSSAQTFVKLFLDNIWKPFEGEAPPEDAWPEISDAIERLRPLASDAVLAVFQLAMDDAVEEAFGRELKRLRREAKRRR